MKKHSKYRVMYANIFENYYWTNMKKTCRKYVTNCSICKKTKTYNVQKQKLLFSFSIFEKKWTNLFMNFVMNFSKCRKKNKIYKNILIMIDRFTKKKIYEFMKFMKTKNLLKILHRRIFNCYDFSISIINDRKKQMISKLWQKICKKYEINNKLSFAHHSKIDEQTKNANKIMKNYLKIYVKYAQNDWMNYFSNVEFATNNYIDASTNMISFFAKHEYHFKNETKSFELYEKTITKKTKLMKTNKIVKKQKTLQHYFKKQLMIAQNN